MCFSKCGFYTIGYFDELPRFTQWHLYLKVELLDVMTKVNVKL